MAGELQAVLDKDGEGGLDDAIAAFWKQSEQGGKYTRIKAGLETEVDGLWMPRAEVCVCQWTNLSQTETTRFRNARGQHSPLVAVFLIQSISSSMLRSRLNVFNL